MHERPKLHVTVVLDNMMDSQLCKEEMKIKGGYEQNEKNLGK